MRRFPHTYAFYCYVRLLFCAFRHICIGVFFFIRERKRIWFIQWWLMRMCVDTSTSQTFSLWLKQNGQNQFGITLKRSCIICHVLPKTMPHFCNEYSHIWTMVDVHTCAIFIFLSMHNIFHFVAAARSCDDWFGWTPNATCCVWKLVRNSNANTLPFFVLFSPNGTAVSMAKMLMEKKN